MVSLKEAHASAIRLTLINKFLLGTSNKKKTITNEHIKEYRAICTIYKVF